MNTDIYLLHHYHIYIEKNGIFPVKAYEVDFQNKRKHILSTIGEFYEREVLCDVNPIVNKKINMTSLITGKVKSVDKTDLVFGGEFVDSCGMASHTLSAEVVWKAYKEFFERQSFIANFLFQLNAEKILIDKSLDILKNDNYIKNYLNDILYFNISLSNNIYVVLAFGWADDSKAVGLGTSKNLKKAVEKAQKEIMQYYAVSLNKEKRIFKRKIKLGFKDAYQEYFDSISIEKFKELYGYFNKVNKNIYVLDNEISRIENSEIIRGNYYKLNMEPFIAVFDGRENTGVKIVKIKDFNWFPHMRPEIFSNEIIEKIEQKFGWKRKNFDAWLPFI